MLDRDWPALTLCNRSLSRQARVQGVGNGARTEMLFDSPTDAASYSASYALRAQGVRNDRARLARPGPLHCTLLSELSKTSTKSPCDTSSRFDPVDPPMDSVDKLAKETRWQTTLTHLCHRSSALLFRLLCPLQAQQRLACGIECGRPRKMATEHCSTLAGLERASKAAKNNVYPAFPGSHNPTGLRRKTRSIYALGKSQWRSAGRKRRAWLVRKCEIMHCRRPATQP